MFMTDHSRIEFALIPNMLLAMVADSFDGNPADDQERQKVERWLAEASLVPFEGLPSSKQRSLLRRVVRLHDDLMAPYRATGQSVAKAGLIAYYLLEAITESEYLVINDGSPLQKALDVILPALEPAANRPDFDADAQRAARHVMTKLHGMRYFNPVVLA